jgi:hypothetical protein
MFICPRSEDRCNQLPGVLTPGIGNGKREGFSRIAMVNALLGIRIKKINGRLASVVSNHLVTRHF